jgi:surface antigen
VTTARNDFGLGYFLALAVVLILLGACGTTAPTEPAAAAVQYRGLDDDDLAIMAASLQQTLESVLSGDTRHWRNDATGRAGSVRPIRSFRNVAGYYCRNFEESITAADAVVSRRQTACRTRSGVWVIALDADPAP